VYTPRAYRCYTSLLNVHDFYTHISTSIYLCIMYMYFYQWRSKWCRGMSTKRSRKIDISPTNKKKNTGRRTTDKIIASRN